MPKFLHSLKLQIIFAITLLTALFASSTLYSLHIIDQQRSDDVLVQLAGRLKFNQQHLTVQAMRYKDNAPRDYPSYYRDLQLYFEDLKKTRTELSAIIDAFAGNRFPRELVGEWMTMTPRLPPKSHAAALELREAWRAFLVQFDERIGPDPGAPRLEWAAQSIVEHNALLEDTAERLSAVLEADVRARAHRANLVNRVLLVASLLVSAGIAVWFYRRVLAPLAEAVDGFRQVANGDFSYRVPVTRNNELGMLADSFNQLADRLEALRRLLTRLEQGADLEGTLRTLSETLPALIPVDWIGVLVIGADGRIHLEKAFTDGRPDPVGKLSFEPDKTLLEECVSTREPLHIADVREVASLSDAYVFLRKLAELGRRDAIFLPIGSLAAIQGVAVFANRYPNSFHSEHLALLRNLGVLVGVSLARTIQLVESSRLASIGQFASGIVHEIRNPLATIGLALEHLKDNAQMAERDTRRLDLAEEEVERLERLLADILLYAKPLVLKRTPQDVAKLLSGVVSAESDPAHRVDLVTEPCAAVALDSDRIRQVLINLLQNAQQATPPDTPIGASCRQTDAEWVDIEISNQGDPIPPNILDRVLEPFVTSKTHGTGLGLAIVQRIVSAHSGTVDIQSDATRGTRVRVRLPVASDAVRLDAGKGHTEHGA